MARWRRLFGREWDSDARRIVQSLIIPQNSHGRLRRTWAEGLHLPNHTSKMVLPTVKLGPPDCTVLRTRPFRATSAASAPPTGESSGVGME